MTKSDETGDKPPVVPVPAATVLLVRDGADGLEVFMVVRHRQIEFASGALVFPGGKVDPGDGAPETLRHAAGIAGMSPEAAALRVAAIRETFEEASVLLARAGDGSTLGSDRLEALTDRYRRPIHQCEIGMDALAVAEDLILCTDQLVPFAHWITPVDQRRRYDTHFFLAAAPPGQHVGLHDGAESVDSVWIRPADALAQAESGERFVVFPTRMNLKKLGASDSVAGALAAAAAAPVVTVLPDIEQLPEGRRIRIPAEAGYGVSELVTNIKRA